MLCLIFANMFSVVSTWRSYGEKWNVSWFPKKTKEKTWTFRRVQRSDEQETITLCLPYDKNLTFMWAVAPVFPAPCSPHRLDLSLWFSSLPWEYTFHISRFRWAFHKSIIQWFHQSSTLPLKTPNRRWELCIVMLRLCRICWPIDRHWAVCA